MLKLRSFIPQDADTVVTWPQDIAEFKQFSGNRYDHFPIEGKDMNEYYAKNPQMWPMIVFDDKGLVAHLVLAYVDDEKSAVKLSFVLADPERRGFGFGAEAVRMAVKFAFEFLDAKCVELTVFENNVPARRCYESVGFEVVPLAEELRFEILGEQWNCLVMAVDRP